MTKNEAKVTAAFRTTDNLPLFVEVSVSDELLASMPKSAKFNRYGYIRINLEPNGTRGEMNEAGAKRYRSAMKALDKAGAEITWKSPAINNYKTREAFEAAIA